MPSRKRPDGTFQDIAHPINNETRAWMEQKVIDAYNLEKEKTGSEAGVEIAQD
jgi:stage V sporulation protein G